MLKVFKFGGAAMADAQTIQKVVRIARSELRNNTRLLIVNSALHGITDQLDALCHTAVEGHFKDSMIDEILARHLTVIKELSLNDSELESRCANRLAKVAELLRSIQTLNELTPRAKDQVLTAGEYLASDILYRYCDGLEQRTQWLDPYNVIRVETKDGISFPDLPTTSKNFDQWLQKHPFNLTVMPGFIGKNEDGTLVTLGRGGSDLSATVIANAAGASSVTLYKEVDGLMTADPRVVPEARIVGFMHYREAAELAYYGAKVLHPRTIIPLQDKKIPLRIANFHKPEAVGTQILAELSPGEFPVKALTAVDQQSIVSIEGNGMMGVPGIAGRAFVALASQEVSVTLISQASSESSICFTIAEKDEKKALKALNSAFEFEMSKELISKIYAKPGKSIVAIVGMGMGGTQGIASRSFHALAAARVNIQAIAQGSTELNISLVVDGGHRDTALRALHREFRLEKFRSLQQSESGTNSLAILGFGQIARALMGQLQAQGPYFEEKLQIKNEVVAISDSSGLLFSNRAFDNNEIEELVRFKTRGMRLHAFNGYNLDPNPAEGLNKNIFNQAFHKGILVDLTAADSFPILIAAIDAKMNVVLANKRPLAVPFEDFVELFAKAKRMNVQVRYEATVGAGLPVLDTIAKLHDVGDEILSIKGCFSGTLGYIFDALENGHSFSSAVASAYANGYTEPDPRDDLSGVDVARKALILARTLGFKFEFSDIQLTGLYNKDQENDDPKKFIENLQSSDNEWAEARERSIKNTQALRYVASIAKDRLEVGVQSVDKASALGQLSGTDNLIQIRTRMYDENPLILTGPGAGAAVTAAGVLNDIMAIATNVR